MIRQISNIPEDLHSIGSYKVEMLLASNSGQAKVFLVSQDKRLYAAKILFSDDAWQKQTNLLQKLNEQDPTDVHGIIKMIDSEIDYKIVANPISQQAEPEISKWPTIIMQFAEKGELFVFVKRTGRFPAEICRTLFSDLLDIIQWVHRNNIVHRDVKPENILFDENYRMRLVDFGMSTNAEGAEGDGIFHTRLGTKSYWAPQIHRRNYNGIKTDVFAAGIILFIMFTRAPPFLSTLPNDENYKYYCLYGKDKIEQYWEKVDKCLDKNQKIPQDIKKLFVSMFAENHEWRPTIQQIRQFQWMKGKKANQQEVISFLNGRHTKLLAKSVTKQKIKQIKQQLLKQVKQFEEQPADTARFDQQEFLTLKRKYNYVDKIIDPSVYHIPQNNGVQYLKKYWIDVQPSFLLAWIQQYLSGCPQLISSLNQLFLQNLSVQEINMNFIEEISSMQINLIILIGLKQYKLQISGSIIRGVEAQREFSFINMRLQSGNQYIGQCIIDLINEQFQLLTE